MKKILVSLIILVSLVGGCFAQKKVYGYSEFIYNTETREQYLEAGARTSDGVDIIIKGERTYFVVKDFGYIEANVPNWLAIQVLANNEVAGGILRSLCYCIQLNETIEIKYLYIENNRLYINISETYRQMSKEERKEQADEVFNKMLEYYDSLMMF